MNPCTDKLGGAPSENAGLVGRKKCTLAPSPKCFKLQERFLMIQSGLVDNRDDLVTKIWGTEKSCEETKVVYETEIAEDKKILEEPQPQLATSMASEAQSGHI